MGGYAEPSYEVAYGPDRTTLTLPLVSADSTGQERSKTIEDGLTDAQIAIVNYLRNEGPSRTSEIAVGIEKSVARTNVILRQLVESGIRAPDAGELVLRVCRMVVQGRLRLQTRAGCWMVHGPMAMMPGYPNGLERLIRA